MISFIFYTCSRNTNTVYIIIICQKFLFRSFRKLYINGIQIGYITRSLSISFLFFFFSIVFYAARDCTAARKCNRSITVFVARKLIERFFVSHANNDRLTRWGHAKCKREQTQYYNRYLSSYAHAKRSSCIRRTLMNLH